MPDILELVEISELKRIGQKITKRAIIDSPKEVIYRTHFFALEFERQTVETLISEEALLLAKFLRNERETSLLSYCIGQKSLPMIQALSKG